MHFRRTLGSLLDGMYNYTKPSFFPTGHWGERDIFGPWTLYFFFIFSLFFFTINIISTRYETSNIQQVLTFKPICLSLASLQLYIVSGKVNSKFQFI